MCRSNRHKKQSGHQLGGGRRRGGVQAARQKARPDERPPIYRVVARGAINSRGFTATRKRASLFPRARARACIRIPRNLRSAPRQFGLSIRIPVQEHPALVIRNISAGEVRPERPSFITFLSRDTGRRFFAFPRDSIFFLAVNWLYGLPVRYRRDRDCWPNVRTTRYHVVRCVHGQLASIVRTQCRGCSLNHTTDLQTVTQTR